MRSIIKDNENPTFVTSNMKENLMAVWSWDYGNHVPLSASTHSTESTKWTIFDRMASEGGENDVKKWEFYHCLVKPQHQQETKEENQEEQKPEEQKPKSKSLLPNVFNKESRIKSMIVDNVEQLNPIKMFGNHKRSASASDAAMSEDDRRDFVGQKVEVALSRAKKTFTLKQHAKKYDTLDDKTDTVTESLETPQSPQSPDSFGVNVHAFKDQYSSVMDIVFTNPIAMAKSKAFKARNTPQAARKTVNDSAGIPSIPEYTESPAVTRQSLGNFFGDHSTPSSKRKSKTRKSKLQKALSVSHLLEDDEDDDTSDDRSAATTLSHTRRKKTKEPQRRRSSSVGAIPDDKAAKTKKKKVKDGKRSSSAGRPKRTSQLRKAASSRNFDSERQSDDDDDEIPTGSKSQRSRSSSAGRAKRTSQLRKAASSRNFDSERQSDDDDDEIPTGSKSQRSRSSSAGRAKRTSQLRKAASSRNFDSERQSEDDGDEIPTGSKSQRSRSSSAGRAKKTSHLQKAASARNIDGERQSDDDEDEISTASKSPRTKRKTRRVPKLKKEKLEGNADDTASKRRSKKKDANNKLQVLNSRMRKTIGMEALADGSGSSAKNGSRSRSLDERRARKRMSQQKLKGAFDKIVVDSAVGGVDATKSAGKTVGKGAILATKSVGKVGADVTKGAIGATKTVGKGAIDATKTVSKGAIGVTKTVGKGAMGMTKTVGKGALDVTKGMGKAIGVTKSTPPPATRTE
ncbi:MAG: hypothetical protein SGBAC_012391 [Bacillariaceae sp.]